MSKLKTFICAGMIAACAAVTTQAWAQSKFRVPVNYSVKLVDGQTSDFDYSKSDRTINFAEDGRHQIVLLFEGSFGGSRDQRMVQAANPIVIDIFDIRDGETFTFNYAMPANLRDAELYSRTQKIDLMTIDRHLLTEEQASYYILASETGFSVLRDYRQDLMSLNRLYAPNYLSGNQRTMGMTTYGAPTITATAGSNIFSGDDNRRNITMAAPMTSSAQEGNMRTSSTSGGAVQGPQGKLRDLIEFYESCDDKTKLEFVKYVMQH